MATETLKPVQKFQSLDQEYFKRRERFAEKHKDAGFWFIADNWPLFAGQVNIARFLAIYDLAKKAAELPGHFCELGCWNGTNLLFLAKIVGLLRPQGLTEVFGFDSFEGLKNLEGGKDPKAAGTRGRYKGDLELLRESLELHGLSESVRVIKGDIEKTLPAFLEERKDVRFSFVYFDTDLYPSTKQGIELLFPRLLRGGVMVFDEYNMADWPGETSAVHDALKSVKLLGVPGTRQPTAYLVKE